MRRHLLSSIPLFLTLVALTVIAASAGGVQARPIAHTGATTPVTPTTESTPTTAITSPGSDGQGVRITTSGGVSFVYTSTAAAAYKTIAGHRVAIACATVARTTGGLLSASAPAFAVVTAPRSGGTVRSSLTARADYCTLGLVVGKKDTIKTLIPVTRLGSLYLNQTRNIRTIFTVFYFPGSYIAAQEGPILLAINGVALKREGPPIPRGKMGLYYRTGHLYIGTVDAAGVLIFARNDNGTLASNLLGQLGGASLPGGFAGEAVPLPKKAA